MKIFTSISALSYVGGNLHLARRYLEANRIVNAFVWKEGGRRYQVLEGNSQDERGFPCAEFTTKREAKEHAEKINQFIKENVLKEAAQ